MSVIALLREGELIRVAPGRRLLALGKQADGWHDRATRATQRLRDPTRVGHPSSSPCLLLHLLLPANLCKIPPCACGQVSVNVSRRRAHREFSRRRTAACPDRGAARGLRPTPRPVSGIGSTPGPPLSADCQPARRLCSPGRALRLGCVRRGPHGRRPADPSSYGFSSAGVLAERTRQPCPPPRRAGRGLL